MGWSENHLDKLPGIKSVAKQRFPGCFSCHKCGSNLGPAGQVQALVLQYSVPREWRDAAGMGLHKWSVLCRKCELDLTSRAVDSIRPYDSGAGSFVS